MSVKHIELAKSREKRGWLQLLKSRFAVLVLAGSVTVPLAGCTAMTGLNNSWQYNGYWNQTMMGHRNKTSASKAWHCRKHHFCNEKYLREFSQGFKAGYMDVADGGTGMHSGIPTTRVLGMEIPVVRRPSASRSLVLWISARCTEPQKKTASATGPRSKRPRIFKINTINTEC